MKITERYDIELFNADGEKMESNKATGAEYPSKEVIGRVVLENHAAYGCVKKMYVAEETVPPLAYEVELYNEEVLAELQKLDVNGAFQLIPDEITINITAFRGNK